ncbi:hypothetical protein CO110_06840 [Candidatus Desantisbacteria bacterium CG_4_9_14_3_um_filter_40_11]|uniref:Uncharacterized protein n=1 Tax=Candidatus Desantisbacteria bacterium CG_4_9_14_3_um_filter_40_11 TaxID=1974546 RepID=A0A2M8ASQ7_9BACT|nr:MAG: hypothetical protein CO110_06840 [Candidatus Desantisbacteria bacterium CG_4_9_14_3_um_filter_40_11]
MDKLPDVLTDKQKIDKINRLLSKTMAKRLNLIETIGTKKLLSGYLKKLKNPLYFRALATNFPPVQTTFLTQRTQSSKELKNLYFLCDLCVNLLRQLTFLSVFL